MHQICTSSDGCNLAYFCILLLKFVVQTPNVDLIKFMNYNLLLNYKTKITSMIYLRRAYKNLRLFCFVVFTFADNKMILNSYEMLQMHVLSARRFYTEQSTTTMMLHFTGNRKINTMNDMVCVERI